MVHPRPPRQCRSRPRNGRRRPMTPLGTSRHLAARMGRWSASHWKTATFGWLAFVALSLVLGSLLGTKKLDANKAGAGESGHVQAVLADKFKQSANESVLVQSSSATLAAPAFRQAVADVAATLRAQGAVRDVRSPLATGEKGLVSADRHSVLVQFKLRGTDMAVSDKRVLGVEKAIAGIQRAHPRFSIGEAGEASVDQALNASISSDFEKAGLFSLPVTLAVLLVAFGALIAAGLPLLLALTAVAGTMGLLALP